MVARPTDRWTAAEYRAFIEGGTVTTRLHQQIGPAKPWSAATATTCVDGHRHPSKMEARVCGRLGSECRRDGTVLYRQVRLPLLSIAPKENGVPMSACIDFAIVRGGKLLRLIDAKGSRVSREWKRGAAAVQAAWGVKIEEVDR